MRMIYYNEVYELESELMDVIAEDGGVALIADNETLQEVILDFILNGDYEPFLLEVDKFAYNNEYILTIDGKEEKLYLEQAFNTNTGRYIAVDCKCYVEDTVNSKFVIDAKRNDFVQNFKAVLFTFDPDYEEEPEEDTELKLKSFMEWDDDRKGFCYCKRDENGIRQFSYRGTIPLTDEVAKAIIKYRFG